MRRVTDTSIPEDEAFRAVEKFIVPMWKNATEQGERRFWHEYFYELIQAIGPELHKGPTDECWLLAAARAKLPLVVPGYEDSTFGNIFASHVKTGECSAAIAKSGIEYMAAFYDYTLFSPLTGSYSFSSLANFQRGTYTQYTQSQIPNYWRWAQDFVLSDRFFSSMHGPSFPNHLYSMAAQSGGARDNPGPLNSNWGCDAPPGERVKVYDQEGQVEHVVVAEFGAPPDPTGP